jgi:diaminohydroxyphosphoribosylaminopyrimidine deaminase/5-amino-6-(5-phosphoribosylamino)uracil reductase
MSGNTNDKIFMKKALALAARAKGRTSPNPMVGAVVVKGGTIIGAGYHKKAGTPHAEILALKKAGQNAKNATLYVTLEPCCHTDKKTPPCTKEIIRSKIKKVVVAMTDPNPKVSGKGISELQEAGIQTQVGIMEPEAERLNEAFTKFISTKRPFVTLKIAQSIDGRIATARGESKWITGPEARAYVHRLRNEFDAVLVGIGTVKKDDPSLDCRMPGGRNPFRIVLDSSLQIPLNSKILRHGDGKTIIAATILAPERKIEQIRKQGHTVLVINGTRTSKKRRADNPGPGVLQVDLKRLMKELGKMEITAVMIEGGSSVAAAALSEKIVDKVLFFIAPKIIGGTDAVPSVGGKSPLLLKHALNLNIAHITTFGSDICMEGYVQERRTRLLKAELNKEGARIRGKRDHNNRFI